MLENLAILIENAIVEIDLWAPVFACFLILIESMIPILPLCTFITINFISFGNILGFMISWFFTCLGCLLSYFLVKKGLANFRNNRLETRSLLDKCLNFVNNLSFPKFTMVLALPFTPAFMINIAAGLVNMKFSKFLLAILISKIFMVYFWGYIGVSFIESLTSPLILIKIFFMLLMAYIISKIIYLFVGEK